MRKIFNNVLINYRIKRNKSNDNFVLLLHGWGGSLNSFKSVEDYLFNIGYSTINLDFPGFGSSGLPNNNFTLNDYAIIVKELLISENISNISIISHSFGGRVAIILASSTTLINKLILVDSAGIKPKCNIKKFIKIKIFKLKRFFNNKFKFKFNLDKYGSDDYKALPNELKHVFNNVVNQDLKQNLNAIECSTLIVWGDKDKSTPLYMAKILNNKIKNSQLKIYKNSGHFSYLQNFNNFCELVNNFLNNKEIE